MEGLQDVRAGLEAAASEALGDIRAKWKEFNQHSGVIESFVGFVSAVDWSVRGCPVDSSIQSRSYLFDVIHHWPHLQQLQEPWLIAVLAVELLLLLFLIIFRKRTTFQGVVMLGAGRHLPSMLLAECTTQQSLPLAKQLTSKEHICVLGASIFATAQRQRQASARVC